MIKDYLNRPLKIGDLVLVTNVRLSGKNKFTIGLVVGSEGIYIGDDVLCHKCDECYLIDNLDENELRIKKELGDKYNLLTKKKNTLKNISQIPGGIYKRGNGQFYLYLGKYQLSHNYAMYVKDKNEYIGYLYVQLSEGELNKLLLRQEVDVSELFYNQLSYMNGVKYISSGYKTVIDNIIMLSSKATIKEDLGVVSLKGFLNQNRDINVVKYMDNLNITYEYARYIYDAIDSSDDMTFVYCGD